MENYKKRWARWIALLVALIVLSPLVQNWREKPADSFPLSYYPMFSEKRDPEQKVTHFIGIDPSGARQNLRYSLAGQGGLNQLRKQIRKKVSDMEADELCLQVASGVNKRKKLRAITEVRIVTGTYNMYDYFSGQRSPLKERIHATCEVGRT